MKLNKMEIEGYRSIKSKLELHFDPRITVVLGANDHGKTNLLEALLHLNTDHGFDTETDLNWDSEHKKDLFPQITYEFTLSNADRDSISLEYAKAKKIEYAKEIIDEEGTQIQSIQKQLTINSDLFEGLSNNLEALESKYAGYVEEQGTEPSTLESAKAEIQAIKDQLADAESAREELDLALAARNIPWLRAIRYELDAHYPLSEDTPSADLLSAVTEEFKAAENWQQSNQENVDQYSAKITESRNAGNEEAAKKAESQLRAVEKSLRSATRRAQLLRERMDRATELHTFTTESQEIEISPYEAPDPNLTDIPEVLRIGRSGIQGRLNIIEDDPVLYDLLWECFGENLPRVIIVKPVDQVVDTVSRADMDQNEHAFMRGIFYYAGIDREQWDDIFEQNDVTSRKLNEASKTLNTTLQESWSQGQNIEFRLEHDSSEGRIDLKLVDPSIQNRYARASKRSTGFTHFFALKTILHAQEYEANASSYIWLFDEPGLHLHPTGQHDLIQVLETLAQKNQIVYTTHSLFLTNKNYPARHRLVVKDEQKGTRIDGKPYSGQWRSAINTLGWSLPGTVLFANKVLLVEGDSDPLYLNALFQKLIQLSELSVDTNSLAIIPTGESKHADALVRMLKEASTPPDIAAIFDGDEGGEDRKKSLDILPKSYKLRTELLKKGTSIEDYLIKPAPLYVEAVAKYLSKIGSPSSEDISSALSTSFDEKFGKVKPNKIAGLAKWSRSEGKEIAELEKEPSSIGIAREYGALLEPLSKDDLQNDLDLERAKEIAELICKLLDLPRQTISQNEIFQSG